MSASPLQISTSGVPLTGPALRPVSAVNTTGSPGLRPSSAKPLPPSTRNHSASVISNNSEFQVTKDVHALATSNPSPASPQSASSVVPVLVEVPRGTPNKYEIDHNTGLLALDRVLHSSIFYPGDYGFVPETLCGDGDPVDVLILSNYTLEAGTVVDARIVGVMEMEDEKGEDWKLIAVVHKDPRSKEIQNLQDVPQHKRAEIRHFFQNYKLLEGSSSTPKWAKIVGFHDKFSAIKCLEDSRELFLTSGQELEEHKLEAMAPPKITDISHAARDLFGITRAGEVPRSDLYPSIVQAYIECPKGANNKYEFDHDTGFVRLDRVLHSAVFYPYDYGFIPRTLCGDGDPLDILILSTYPLVVNTLVDARVIGVMDMEDEKGHDAKLLAVVHQDPRFEEIHDLCHVPDHIKAEIRHFFESYKTLENNKWAKVTGWRDREHAIKEVVDSAATYDANPGTLEHVNDLYRLNIGDDAPAKVFAVVECPKGSSNKYKFCKQIGLMKLDRVFHSSAFYPGNYGFVPSTLGPDGNPLDVLILSSFPLAQACLVEVRPVAMLSLVDERGPDDKIICVPVHEPRLHEVEDLDSISAHVKQEITNFFMHFKDLEPEKGAFCRVTGWWDKATAIKKIKEGHELHYLFGLRMMAAEKRIYDLSKETSKLKAQLATQETNTKAALTTMSKQIEDLQMGMP